MPMQLSILACPELEDRLQLRVRIGGQVGGEKMSQHIQIQQTNNTQEQTGEYTDKQISSASFWKEE